MMSISPFAGPASLHPHGPERRPQPRAGIDAGAHFEPAVEPTGNAFGGQAGGSVFGKFAIVLPIGAARLEIGIGLAFPPAFDNQHAVFAPGVFRLIPLQFLVPHEARFVGPFGRIGPAGAVEFIGPDQLPAIGGLRAGRRRRQRQGHPHPEYLHAENPGGCSSIT